MARLVTNILRFKDLVSRKALFVFNIENFWEDLVSTITEEIPKYSDHIKIT